jgi:hypothetical protein
MRIKLPVWSGLQLFAACVLIFAQGAKPNFSGVWNLDKDKSDMSGGPGGGPRMVSPSMTIEHKDPQLIIKRKFEFQGEERTQEMKYTTDGKPNTNEGFRGRTVKSKTSWDGDKLVTEATRETPQGTFETKETYSLSDDGKSLTIEMTRAGATGPSRKSVYTKQ